VVSDAIRVLRNEHKHASIVGMGTSMEPYIEDGTRMVFEPYDGMAGEIVVGGTYMTVVKYISGLGLDMHLVKEVDDSDDTFRVGSPEGWDVGWCYRHNVIGRYLGDWNVLRRRGIRVAKHNTGTST